MRWNRQACHVSCWIGPRVCFIGVAQCMTYTLYLLTLSRNFASPWLCGETISHHAPSLCIQILKYKLLKSLVEDGKNEFTVFHKPLLSIVARYSYQTATQLNTCHRRSHLQRQCLPRLPHQRLHPAYPHPFRTCSLPQMSAMRLRLAQWQRCG